MPPTGDDEALIAKFRALLAERSGTTVRIYVPKRQPIDWDAVRAERVAGARVVDLAVRLGVTERTIYARAPLKKPD